MDERLSAIYENVRKFPKRPGVYIMRNDRGRVIYVGKAKVLRKRVSDYFLKSQGSKTRALLSHVSAIDYVVTSSEYEALILENNLIKKHKPHYNIDLKDDKTYAMIKITREDYPRVLKTRRKTADGGAYFGPYPKTEELDVFMRIIEDSFSYRRCNKLKKMEKPCLYYHIGKCPGPCFTQCDIQSYRKQMRAIARFLNGDSDDMKSVIEKRMRSCADSLDFEGAMEQKRKLDVIGRFQSLQAVGNIAESKNIDYIGSYSEGDMVFMYIMQYRNSNLLGADSYFVRTLASEEEVFFDFLMQYYTDPDEVPDRIEFSGECDKALIGEYFGKNLKGVDFSGARTKKDFRILELAKMNAKESYGKYMRKKSQRVSEGVRSDALSDPGIAADAEKPGPQDANAPMSLERSGEYSDRHARKALAVNEGDPDDDFRRLLRSFAGIGEERSKAISGMYSDADELLSDGIENVRIKTGLGRKTIERMFRQLKG